MEEKIEDLTYLECDLPSFLEESIKENGPLARDKSYHLWDCCWCELQSDINVAEVEQLITSDQAWYLREKYLGLARKDNT